MTLIDERKLGKAISIGLDRLVGVIKEDSPTKEGLMQARLASSIVSTGARYMAAQNSRLSIQLRVASMVLQDVEERKKYLAASSPELKLLA